MHMNVLGKKASNFVYVFQILKNAYFSEKISLGIFVVFLEAYNIVICSTL